METVTVDLDGPLVFSRPGVQFMLRDPQPQLVVSWKELGRYKGDGVLVSRSDYFVRVWTEEGSSVLRLPAPMWRDVQRHIQNGKGDRMMRITTHAVVVL